MFIPLPLEVGTLEAHHCGAVDSSSCLGNCVISICMIKEGLFSTFIMILCGSSRRRDGNIEFDLREMCFDNVSNI